jgi:PAS domain S-box-containing protein
MRRSRILSGKISVSALLAHLIGDLLWDMRAMGYRRIIDWLKNRSCGFSEQAPQGSCEFIDMLLDRLPIGLALLNSEKLELPFLNRNFAETLRRSPADFTDLPELLRQLISDTELCQRLTAQIRKDIASGASTSMVWEFAVVMNGEDVWLRFSATPLEADQLLLRVEDVSEHKHLRESEEQFRALVDQASDSFFLMDATGKLLDVNPAACRGLDYSREELLALKVYDIDPGFTTEQHIDRYWEPLQRGQPVIFETYQLRKDGSTFPVEVVLGMIKLGEEKRFLGIHRDLTRRKQAEETLRRSEERRCRLQIELAYAAEVQQNLLPADVPILDAFEIAARCRPAQHVAGDFYDWQQLSEQVMMVSLGDVMGKGLAAAMLMATVRSVLRGVAPKNRPARALYHAEKALHQDLDRSDSFVTLFYSHLDLETKRLDYVDCGHGHAFLRRSAGPVEELLPRGLPLGVSGKGDYQQGSIVFAAGDALVLYSDGLIDALPGSNLDYAALAGILEGAESADEMLERLTGLVPESVAAPDDLTVLVLRCKA